MIKPDNFVDKHRISQRSMKIAFLAGHLSRRASGIREVTEHLSCALTARGHVVRVFGLDDTAWHEGDAAAWTGAPVTVSWPLGPRALGFAPNLWPALARFNPDIVHLHGLWMANSALAAHWVYRSGGPLVVSPHGMLSDVALGYSKGRKWFASAFYQNRCFRATRLFHATCSEEEAEIRAFGLEAPVAIVPIGVPDLPTALRDSPPARDKVVITLGRLHRKKGLDRLLRAWTALEPQFRDWRLEIVGPDAGDGYKDHLEAIIAELGLVRVRLAGPAFGDDKWQALLEAEVFVLPTDSENFALTVPEALLAELPVISTDGAPWSELKREEVGWYVSKNEKAIAEALAKAMSLPETERRRMGKSGRAWALRKFNWNNLVAQFEAAYEELLCGKNNDHE